MNKLYLYVFLHIFLIGCNPQLPEQNQSIVNYTPIEEIKEPTKDNCVIVPCMECDGTGIYEYKKDNPLVQLEMVPEGLKETCQPCKGIGKLRECTRPNGMIYHMSL